MSNESRPTAQMIVSVVASKDFQAKLAVSLPKHVDADRFTRMTITAIQGNPDLLNADKESLYLAILQCAQTGLSPDGKKAALVVFNTNVGTKQNPRWIKKVQCLPMIAGIIDKLAEVDIKCDSSVVYANDEFEWEEGDVPYIKHKPAKLGTARGEIIGAYAILRVNGGEAYREVMDREQIERVRSQSRGESSLMWTKFYEEACRKTVLRRCAKRVPMKQEESVLRTLEADDAAFTFPQLSEPENQQAISQTPQQDAPQEQPADKVEAPSPEARPETLQKTAQARPRGLQEVLEHRGKASEIF